ncbi:unnamed protein product, partial [marine sediment metagenome]
PGKSSQTSARARQKGPIGATFHILLNSLPHKDLRLRAQDPDEPENVDLFPPAEIGVKCLGKGGWGLDRDYAEASMNDTWRDKWTM